MHKENESGLTRRNFIQKIGATAATLGAFSLTSSSLAADDLPRDAQGNIIPGFEKNQKVTTSSGAWQSVSDRKIKVGIAGYGLCKFGAQFFYQNHPNVEVVAATDLDPGRCAALAKAVGAAKTYPSCEEMIKDKSIEAIYIATDAPSHARLAIMALNHGKHVCSAVPAVFGFEAEDEAEKLFNAVQSSGLKYMMNETSAYHADLYAKRMQYQAGALGQVMYSEGEYYHDFGSGLPGYNPNNGKIDHMGWRRGLVPMWYPTHSAAYYTSITGGRFMEVSCQGTQSLYVEFQKENNSYQNPFGTEVAMYRTSEGGISRMVVGWDLKDAHGEKGRVYGQKSYKQAKVDGSRPALPPGVGGGGHGGSHGHLTNNFIESILLDQQPNVGIGDALNMTLSGVIAHKSALQNGEWMKIPQYEL